MRHEGVSKTASAANSSHPSRRSSARRRQHEALNLNSPYWRTPETFDDGEALLEAVCERELEGIVAKRVESRYIPGYRGWTKIKNRSYRRYDLERESVRSKRV
jgi:ATP-dependent DNA ligase